MSDSGVHELAQRPRPVTCPVLAAGHSELSAAPVAARRGGGWAEPCGAGPWASGMLLRATAGSRGRLRGATRWRTRPLGVGSWRVKGMGLDGKGRAARARARREAVRPCTAWS
jgi:hypothetical protein